MTNRLYLTCQVCIGIIVKVYHLARSVFFSTFCSSFVALLCYAALESPSFSSNVA